MPKLNDPFETDFHCLQSVPKSDSWEPLVSFAHHTSSGRSRSRSPSKSKPDDWQPLTLASSRSRSRSPVELKTGHWQPLSNSVNPSASRRSRSPKPETFGREELSSEMQDLGLESFRSHFAMLATASKLPESSTMLAAASKVHEPQELHSCRTDFKPMSYSDKTDMKIPTNETSRPLSVSRQKQSSKPKAKQTTSGTEKEKWYR